MSEEKIILEEENNGPDELVKLEEQDQLEKKNKAKELFQFEIIENKIYFTYKNQKYYFKPGTRKDASMFKTFEEERKIDYLLNGLSTLSRVKKMITDSPDLFPPTVYKIVNSYKGNKKIKDIEFLTQEEDDIVMECLRKRKLDINEIKKAAKIPSNVDLVIKDGESATEMINNTAEMRALSDVQEWGYIYNTFYAIGDKKDTRVYSSFEEYLEAPDSSEYYTTVMTVVNNSLENLKKKLTL
jgi:hypothetical protein